MGKAQHVQAKATLPVSQVEARFVYEGGVKGEWVSLDQAMQTWLNPARGYKVQRVEFQEKLRPPRARPGSGD